MESNSPINNLSTGLLDPSCSMNIHFSFLSNQLQWTSFPPPKTEEVGKQVSKASKAYWEKKKPTLLHASDEYFENPFISM